VRREKAEDCFDLFISPPRPAAAKKRRMRNGVTAHLKGKGKRLEKPDQCQTHL